MHGFWLYIDNFETKLLQSAVRSICILEETIKMCLSQLKLFKYKVFNRLLGLLKSVKQLFELIDLELVSI